MGRGKVFPADQARSLLNPLRRLVQSPGRTVAAMRLGITDRVLELGAGPGFFSPSIAAAVPNGELVVGDLQFEMVAMASSRLAGHTNVRFAQADAMHLPFASATFDAVLLATMLGEVPDPPACLGEVRRVLRPGGAVSISETRRDSDFIPLAQLRSIVEPAGFAFDARSGVGWQYVARFVAV